MTKSGWIIGFVVLVVALAVAAALSGSDNSADRNVPGATTSSGRNSIASPER